VDDNKAAFYQTLDAIPKGRYISYKALAALCGVHIRQIQAWLRALPTGSDLPWFRVINSQRRISDHPGAANQYQRLAAEGLVPGRDGRFPPEFRWPD
jgi:methylated-DNA-protein-cysteine methyltransferase-like protein